MPEIGNEDDVIIPLVGECDDSWLNDAVGRHVRSEHVYRAIEQATTAPSPRARWARARASSPATSRPASAPLASRVTLGRGGRRRSVHPRHPGEVELRRHALAARRRRARGRAARARASTRRAARQKNAGSIIAIVATDAPLLSPQLVAPVQARRAGHRPRAARSPRTARARSSSAFSTANIVPRAATRMTATIEVLLDEACDPLYEAIVECTEEAIVNSLCMANEMRGPRRSRRAGVAFRPSARHPETARYRPDVPRRAATRSPMRICFVVASAASNRPPSPGFTSRSRRTGVVTTFASYPSTICRSSTTTPCSP